MRKLIFLFLFLPLFSAAQHKFILLGDGTSNYGEFFWSDTTNWDVYPGNHIFSGDTVLVKSRSARAPYFAVFFDLSLAFDSGSVLIIDSNTHFQRIVNPVQQNCNLKISKLINYGSYYDDKDNNSIYANDSIINYGTMKFGASNLKLFQNGVIINNKHLESINIASQISNGGSSNYKLINNDIWELTNNYFDCDIENGVTGVMNINQDFFYCESLVNRGILNINSSNSLSCAWLIFDLINKNTGTIDVNASCVEMTSNSLYFQSKNYGTMNLKGLFKTNNSLNYGVINNYCNYPTSENESCSWGNFATINNYGLIPGGFSIGNFGVNSVFNNYSIVQVSGFSDFNYNNYGVYHGSGTIVSNGGSGTISPSNNDNFSYYSNYESFGCINVIGNLRGFSTYDIEIADTVHCISQDFISVSDTIFASGGLNLSYTYDQYYNQPNPNIVYTIMHADTVVNAFDYVPEDWIVLYNQPKKGDVSVRYHNHCDDINSDFLQDSLSVCGNSVVLHVPDNFDWYMWSNNTYESVITINSSGWYSCEVTKLGCVFKDSVYIRMLNIDITQNDTLICSGTSLTLTANSSNSIFWSNNTTGNSTIVTPSLTTTYYVTATDGVLTCRDSVKVNINTTLPSTPFTINGPSDICPLLGNNITSSVVNYTTRKIANANSYLWTLPLGVTLVSGQGDTAVNVTFSNSFVSGVISVKSVNACGVSTGTRTIAVYKRIASIPGAMYQSFSPVAAAVTSVCGRTSETYKVRKVAYATSYIWSLSNGSFATISHTNTSSINDTAISVNFQSGFTKDTLIVKSITACSVSASRSIVLNALAVPAAVSSIVSGTGNTTPCIGDVVNYSASSLVPTTAQTSAAVYRWSKPNNTSITSANTDSSVITLRFNAGFTGGSIVAKGQSACGVYGSSKTLVLQYLPPTPTAIVSGIGNYNACIGNAITYSAMVPPPSATQRAAVVFRWTKPAYTTIVSANSDSSVISLQFNTGYRGGTLSVKGQTICGALGTAKAQALTHSLCATGNTPALYTRIENKNDSDFDVNVYPNPSQNDFNLKIIDKGLKNYEIAIRDVEGRLLKKNITSDKTIQWGANLQPGVYFIEVKSDVRRKVIRAVKI